MKTFKEYIDNILNENWIQEQPVEYLQRYLKIHKPHQKLKFAIQDEIHKRSNEHSKENICMDKDSNIDKLVKNIKEKIDDNFHNEAILQLAEFLESKNSVDIMKNIITQHHLRGLMTRELIDLRNEHFEKLMKLAEEELDKDVVDKIKDAF